MIWTPELDARVAGLLRAEKTASQIGAELGVSRNAVIGRVTRCKMLREIGFARGPRCHYLPSVISRSGEKKKARRAPGNGLLLLPEPVIPKPAFVAPHHAGVSLMDLGPRHCRFCINDPEQGANAHLFCGEETEPGSPWCAYHETIVWGRGTAAGTTEVHSAKRIAA